ncbi:hypothetical protein ACSYGO_24300 [Streptomyces krungchingensis]
MGRRTVWWLGRALPAAGAALVAVLVPTWQAGAADADGAQQVGGDRGGTRPIAAHAGTMRTVGADGGGARTVSADGGGARTAGDAVADAEPTPYAFAEDATSVDGATGTTGAVRLEPGKAYRSSIGKDGKLYYRLVLDDVSNAYVSATAVPRPGTSVSYSDGIKVSVQDGNSRNCSFSGTAHFGATQSSHPIAAWATRETSGHPYACQTAGTYYVVVERSGTAGSSSGVWDLELDCVSEPGLRKTGSTTAPETWNSATPEPLTGDPKRRRGGAGFSTATSLRQGIWQDGISPGQTLFYKVPLDWGQQLHVTAALGSSGRGEGSVGTALVMSLYNPVRGFVDDVGSGYDGGQRSAVLEPLPAVAYENRYALSDRVSGMRFAGSYYLVVHLAAQVADRFGDGPLGLTLSVRRDGAVRAGPSYAGRPEPRDAFDVPADDADDQADDGADAEGAVGGASPEGGGRDRADGTGAGSDSATMRVVAAGGIGTGSLLMLILGVWTVLARRRPVPAPEDADTASAAVPAPWERGAPRSW